MTRAQLIAELALRVTDPKNQQNTAERVRDVITLLINNVYNLEDDPDLQAIESITDTSGLLRKTGESEYELDTSAYPSAKPFTFSSDGITTDYVLAHDFNTKLQVWSVFDLSTGNLIYPQILPSDNTTIIRFNVPPLVGRNFGAFAVAKTNYPVFQQNEMAYKIVEDQDQMVTQSFGNNNILFLLLDKGDLFSQLCYWSRTQGYYAIAAIKTMDTSTDAALSEGVILSENVADEAAMIASSVGSKPKIYLVEDKGDLISPINFWFPSFGYYSTMSLFIDPQPL